MEETPIHRGAKAAAIKFFNDSSDGAQQRIYALHEAGLIPTFTLGRTICFTEAALQAWLQERTEDALERCRRAHAAKAAEAEARREGQRQPEPEPEILPIDKASIAPRGRPRRRPAGGA